MSSSKDAGPRQRAGHWLVCPVCGGKNFWEREAQLNTRLMTFFDLEWINPKGTCYICGNCRYIFWFYGKD